jgi:2,3-bisphosphoglycerate-dependent phosphoglycerate mutase
MKRGYKIYLFRHGQTAFNRDARFTGQLESRLTRLGKKHAEKISRELKNKKFQVAIHTHLSRSKETLKPVLKFHPECKLILQDDRMIERSYGMLEGTTHKQFMEDIGEKDVKVLKERGDALDDLDPELKKRVEQILGEAEYKAIHRGYNVAAPGGESFRDVEKRVKSFIKDLKKFMKKNKVNVAISAHGNSIRLFRKIMENAPKKDVINWFIPYDKVFEYTIK